MDYTSIGKQIRARRIQKKLRQEDVAEMVELSPNYYGSIERGEKIPALDTFITILNALELSADQVLVDVLKVGYTAKNSALDEKMKVLSESERVRIYDVLDVLLRHGEKK